MRSHGQTAKDSISGEVVWGKEDQVSEDNNKCSFNKVFQFYPLPAPQTIPGDSNPPQKPWVVLQPIIKPVIFGGKAN